MRWTVLAVLVIFLSGCTTSLHPTLKKIDNIEPGMMKTAELGGTIYETGYLRVLPGFVASKSSYLPEMDNLLLPVVKKGALWVCNGKLSSGDYLCLNPDIAERDVTTNTGIPLATKLPLFIIKPSGEFSGLYYTDTGRESLQADSLPGLFVYRDVPLEDSYKRRLVYGGRGDLAINLIYQEFNGNMTQPTFSEAISYEMTSANLINVKNVIIEVVEATASSIRYIVKN
jgi:hypothetical protein